MWPEGVEQIRAFLKAPYISRDMSSLRKTQRSKMCASHTVQESAPCCKRNHWQSRHYVIHVRCFHVIDAFVLCCSVFSRVYSVGTPSTASVENKSFDMLGHRPRCVFIPLFSCVHLLTYTYNAMQLLCTPVRGKAEGASLRVHYHTWTVLNS